MLHPSRTPVARVVVMLAVVAGVLALGANNSAWATRSQGLTGQTVPSATPSTVPSATPIPSPTETLIPSPTETPIPSPTPTVTPIFGIFTIFLPVVSRGPTVRARNALLAGGNDSASPPIAGLPGGENDSAYPLTTGSVAPAAVPPAGAIPQPAMLPRTGEPAGSGAPTWMWIVVVLALAVGLPLVLRARQVKRK
jgi:hypothetical protein